MNGYTKGARNEIFALKPAPIQVNKVLHVQVYILQIAKIHIHLILVHYNLMYITCTS